MEKLKAFIGYSFNDKDKSIVDIFLKFFDSLKEAIPFEWDHAEDAKPRELSSKVKEKMEEKNLFIGIFTKKDYRVEPDKMKNSGFIKKKKCASENDIKSGTSDWIIQESGYALGKEMQLLLLVENGVDFVTGLQGDIEYISFFREKPEVCFPKINQMLGSIVKAKEKQISIGEKTLSPQDVREEDEKKEEEIKEKKNFTRWFNDFNTLHKLIIIERDFSEAEKKLHKIIPEYKKEDKFDEIFWKSIFHRMKCIAGVQDSFTELEKLSETHSDNPKPPSDLAYVFKEYDRYEKAAHQYLKASERVKDKPEKIDLIWHAAECYALNKNFPQAYELILSEFSNGELGSDQYHNLYNYLANIAKIEKNDNLFTVFAEKALDYSLADNDIRFSLAYRYGELDNEAAALYHYKILCSKVPNGTNWNNMGVSYESLEMKSKAVSSYRKAADEYDSTLAMSNLGISYIDQGFLSDAEDILKKARSVKNYHRNVDSSIDLIHKAREKEEEREKKILDKVVKEIKFRAEYAEAYAIKSTVSIDGTWKSKHGEIILKRDGERLYGHYKIPRTAIPAPKKNIATPFSNILAGALGDITEKTIKLEAKISDRAIEYELTISAGSAMAPRETGYKGLMCIGKDSSTIEVMEKTKDGKDFDFYEMGKIKDSANNA